MRTSTRHATTSPGSRRSRTDLKAILEQGVIIEATPTEQGRFGAERVVLEAPGGIRERGIHKPPTDSPSAYPLAAALRPSREVALPELAESIGYGDLPVTVYFGEGEWWMRGTLQAFVPDLRLAGEISMDRHVPESEQLDPVRACLLFAFDWITGQGDRHWDNLGVIRELDASQRLRNVPVGIDNGLAMTDQPGRAFFRWPANHLGHITQFPDEARELPLAIDEFESSKLFFRHDFHPNEVRPYIARVVRAREDPGLFDIKPHKLRRSRIQLEYVPNLDEPEWAVKGMTWALRETTPELRRFSARQAREMYDVLGTAYEEVQREGAQQQPEVLGS